MADEINVKVEGKAANFLKMFPDIFSEDWQNWELDDQINFRNILEVFVKGANLCRETFDKQVWKGHENGKVNVKVTSIRTKADGDKPGRKPVEKTMDDLLDERLSK